MNKFIYKQSNKIALALLALGCVVSSLVGAAGPAITTGDKRGLIKLQMKLQVLYLSIRG